MALWVSTGRAEAPISTASSTPAKTRQLDDFAQIYVDQFFEPDARLNLSTEGQKKSAALAQYAIGQLLEDEGRMEDAIAAYRNSLDSQSGQIDLARKTAHLLANSGRVQEGQDLLEKVFSESSDKYLIHLALSEYLSTYRSQDTDAMKRSLEIAEGAVKEFPDEVAVYGHLIALYSSLQRRDEARSIVSEVLKQDHSDPRFWLDLGRIAVRAWPIEKGGSGPNATLVGGIFSKAMDRAGEDEGVIESVGDFYLSSGQIDQAISAFKKCVGMSPASLEVREKLARAYGAAGDTENEIATLEALSKIDSENAEVHRRLAGIFLRAERYKEAIPHFRAALAITKGSEEEYSALGRMMIEAKEYGAAVEFLQQTGGLFPESTEFPLLLTYALSGQEKWADAIVQFQKTIPLAEKNLPQALNAGFYFRYAAAYERNGEFGKAEELFRKTIGMLGNGQDGDGNQKFSATVYNYLGYMWLENDMKIDEAGELIKTASELDPDNGAILDSLGWFYFKKGRFEEARDALQKAESLIDEEDSVIYDHIGQTLHALGDQAKAIEYLEKAAKLSPDKEEYSKRLQSYKEASGTPKQ